MSARSHRRERTWKPGADYRIICTCQRHARTRNAWRRALLGAARGVAVLFGLPIAFAVFDIPLTAMNFDIPSLRRAPAAQTVAPPQQQSALQIFTGTLTSEQFFSSTAVQQAVSIDSYKEQYFRAHVPYGAIIYREARRNGISPELVAAMVHTESDFRAGLVSHKSAQGLMQIVPETARKLGLANVFDPEQNIAAGTRYYKYLLKRFDNEQIALAAYNAGEGNVERFGGIPPFSETERYVEKVHRRAGRYRQHVRSGYLATLRIRSADAH